jgi:TonB family protein
VRGTPLVFAPASLRRECRRRIGPKGSEVVKQIAVLACSIGAWVAIAGAQAPEVAGPRFRSGSVPELPALAVGGGEVLLEVSVTAAGQVSGIRTLRSVQPFTDATIDAVRGWEFAPAEDDEHRPIPSRVLVGALFRPPAVYASPGDSTPSDIARPSSDIPYPLGTVMPVFPPLAHTGGVVLLEAVIGTTGAVEAVQVMRSAPPFDSAAEAAAQRWLFRPAYVAPRAEARFVYLVFGFPTPVTVVPSPNTPR